MANAIDFDTLTPEAQEKLAKSDPAARRYLESKRHPSGRARPAGGRPRARAAGGGSAPAESSAPASAPAASSSAQRGATVSQATAGAGSLAPSSGSVWAVLAIAFSLTVMAVVTDHFSFGFFVAVLFLILVGSILPIVGILLGGTALLYVVLTHGTQLINFVSGLYSLESKGAQAAQGGTA